MRYQIFHPNGRPMAYCRTADELHSFVADFMQAGFYPVYTLDTNRVRQPWRVWRMCNGYPLGTPQAKRPAGLAG